MKDLIIHRLRELQDVILGFYDLAGKDEKQAVEDLLWQEDNIRLTLEEIYLLCELQQTDTSQTSTSKT